jgi:hypothetical protein
VPVAEWDVCGRYFVTTSRHSGLSFGCGDPFVDQRRSANLLEVIETHDHPLTYGIAIRKLVEGVALSSLGALAIAGVTSSISCFSRATAAETKESIPPLNNTTALV